VTGHPTAAVCRSLGVGRATAYLRPRPRTGGFNRRAEDNAVLLQIMAVVGERASYGVRRVCTLVNRTRQAEALPRYNLKRIRRVMRLHTLTLPGKVRRRDRPHTGQVRRPDSNQRWCSDAFNIRCWNGERVQVAFALDCHDREALDWVGVVGDLSGQDIRLLLDKALWARFGERTLKTPIPIEWLSDNGGAYTAFETVSYAHELGFKPITTPAYSPESNGMAEAFVNTMKRDYVSGADLSDAETVLRQLPGWLEDYNRVAPHSALNDLSPREYRERKSQTQCV
jgi:putative transposase